MKNKPKAVNSNPNLPPNIPASLEDYDRAVCLLGNYTKVNGEIKPHQKLKLTSLIGVVPTLDQAVVWKSTMKQQRSTRFNLQP